MIYTRARVPFSTGMSQVAVTSSGMERSIHEMLKDAPSLNESDNAVHTGTPPPHVPNNCSADSQPRPATINLSLGSPTQTCMYGTYPLSSRVLFIDRNPQNLKVKAKRLFLFVAVTVSPNTPVPNGDTQTMRSTQSKIESIKNWSISTYKCTKQLMYERLGKTSRTVDFGAFVVYAR